MKSAQSEVFPPNVKVARQLSPFDPILCAMCAARAFALFRLERFEEAGEWALNAIRQPNAHLHVHALSALAASAAPICDPVSTRRAWRPPAEAALSPEPANIKRKPYLHHCSAVVADFDSHAVCFAILRRTSGRISGKICQRAGGLFLHPRYARKLQPFFIRRDLVTIQ